MLQRPLIKILPFYYGYVIVLGALVGFAMTGPGQTAVVGATISRVVEDFKLERTTVSLFYLFATLGSACTLPFLGRVLDNIGAQKMFILFVIVLGLACYVFSYSVTSWQLMCCFYLLRLGGQGGLWLTATNVINLWFVEKRARIMGMISMIVAFVLTGVFSSITKHFVDVLGWRPTYEWLGFLELVFVLPVGILIIGDRPEKYGLLPDGKGYIELETTSPVASRIGSTIHLVDDDDDRIEDKSPENSTSVSTMMANTISASTMAHTRSNSSSSSASADESTTKHTKHNVSNRTSDGALIGSPKQSNLKLAKKLGEEVVPIAPQSPINLANSSSKRASPSSKNTINSSTTKNTVDRDLDANDKTLAQACRTFTFWYFVMMIMQSAANVTAIFFHLDNILAQYPNDLSFFYLAAAFAAGFSAMVCGFVLDKKYISYERILCVAAMCGCTLFCSMGYGLYLVREVTSEVDVVGHGGVPSGLQTTSGVAGIEMTNSTSSGTTKAVSAAAAATINKAGNSNMRGINRKILRSMDSEANVEALDTVNTELTVNAMPDELSNKLWGSDPRKHYALDNNTDGYAPAEPNYILLLRSLAIGVHDVATHHITSGKHDMSHIKALSTPHQEAHGSIFVKDAHSSNNGSPTRGIDHSRDRAPLHILCWLMILGSLQGISSGIMTTTSATVFAVKFGRTHNGKIQGAANSAMVFASAFGGTLLSMIHDYAGSYYYTLPVLSIWPASLVVIGFTMY